MASLQDAIISEQIFCIALFVRFIGLQLTYTDSKINKTKEAFPMKKNHKKYPHLAIVKPSQPTYPNAADSRYFANKALNIITGIVSGMGLASAMLFMVTLA